MQSGESPNIQRERIQLSATQLIASALAAVTATVAASFLGISGTVIGAAIASVLTVTGNAVYSHSIHRTRDRVRTVVPISPSPVSVRRSRPAIRRMGYAAAGVFVATLALLTSVEWVAGRPVSDLVRGTSARGTTVFGSQQLPGGAATQRPLPAVTVTQTVVPKVVTETPTVTQTAAPVTVRPTSTSTPAPTASPTTSAPSTPSRP
jgi:hypothetical protein